MNIFKFWQDFRAFQIAREEERIYKIGYIDMAASLMSNGKVYLNTTKECHSEAFGRGNSAARQDYRALVDNTIKEAIEREKQNQTIAAGVKKSEETKVRQFVSPTGRDGTPSE